MSVVAIERRLRKLESARLPSKGTLFVIWGHDAADLARRTDEVREAGLIAAGDLLVRAVWPLPDHLPPSRWVTDGELAPDGSTTPFDRAEVAALADYALAGIPEAPESQASPAANSIVEQWPHPDVRPASLNQTSDVQLVSTLLGERYLRGPAPRSDAQWCLAALEVETRASIRGGFDKLHRLRAQQEDGLANRH